MIGEKIIECYTENVKGPVSANDQVFNVYLETDGGLYTLHHAGYEKVGTILNNKRLQKILPLHYKGQKLEEARTGGGDIVVKIGEAGYLEFGFALTLFENRIEEEICFTDIEEADQDYVDFFLSLDAL